MKTIDLSREANASQHAREAAADPPTLPLPLPADPPPPTDPAAEAERVVVAQRAAKARSEHDEAFRFFIEIAATNEWAVPRKLTDARRKTLAACMKEAGGLEAWKQEIERASRSDFLCGRTDRGWKADFGWLSELKNFSKLMEGRYDGRMGPRTRRDVEEEGLRRAFADRGFDFPGPSAELGFGDGRQCGDYRARAVDVAAE